MLGVQNIVDLGIILINIIINIRAPFVALALPLDCRIHQLIQAKVTTRFLLVQKGRSAFALYKSSISTGKGSDVSVMGKSLECYSNSRGNDEVFQKNLKRSNLWR